MKYWVYKAAFICLICVGVYSCKPDLGDYNYGFNQNGLDSTNLEVDTSTQLTNTSKYAKARVFPGLVCDNERIDTTITLDLNYHYVTNAKIRISVPPTPLFSTGLYAAPGDLVTIIVPEGEYSLSVQVGAWTDDLTAKEAEEPLLRDPRIVERKALSPGVNRVRNLYGGHIYIVPSRPISTPLTFKFERVNASPDFVLGKTTNAAWQQKIQNSCVPWLELRSKYIVFVVSREFCLNQRIEDPQALMEEWETAIREDFFGWMGLVEQASDEVDESPALPYRVVFDIQPSVGYGHNGSPIVVTNDYHWFSFCSDLTWLKGSNAWGIYHEIGHNAQMSVWSWSTLGETTNNLFNYKLARRNELSGYPNAWPAKHDSWSAQLVETFDAAIAFANSSGGKNFDGSNEAIDDPFRRMTPFLQIFDFVKPNMPGVNNSPNDGWGFMTYLYQQGRRSVRPPTSDILKHDFVYTNLCEYTKMDWRLFFNAWGIQISNIASAGMFGRYPIMDKEIWNYNPATRDASNVGTVNVDLYSPANWAIESFTSEEPSGEGASNGKAIFLIDGNINSFWHSQWAAASATPPHMLVVDIGRLFGMPLTFSRIKYAHRQSLTRTANLVHFDYSNDNDNWTEIPGSPFTLPKVTGYINLDLGTTISARYVRIRVESAADGDGTNFLAIGEFAVEP
ncbi:M60 family peptidase N-terminal accessory domain-containing protein [Niabella terrae]